MAQKMFLYFMLVFVEICINTYALNLPNKGTEKNRIEGHERKLPGTLMEKNIRNENLHLSASNMNTQDAAFRNMVVFNLTSSTRKIRDISQTENANTDSVPDHACKRHSYVIKFSDIGWDWIQHPESLDIGFCGGTCTAESAPMATNHALIWKLALNLGLAPREEAPCSGCVPSVLLPANVTYKTEDGTLSSVKMPDVVVSECECL